MLCNQAEEPFSRASAGLACVGVCLTMSPDWIYTYQHKHVIDFLSGNTQNVSCSQLYLCGKMLYSVNTAVLE